MPQEKTVRVTETIHHRFIIHLSNKAVIKVDADELDLVMGGIQSGSPVKVRSGIFNPSFFVAIVEDEERRITVERGSEHNRKYARDIEAGNIKAYQFQPLKDIFEGIDLKGRNALRAGQNNLKQIGG